MKKIAAYLLLCALLFSGCAQVLTNVEAEFPTASSVPVPTPAPVPSELFIEQLSLEAVDTTGKACDKRVFEARYDAEALREALFALPAIHIETPETGEKKFYADQSPWGVYKTSGSIKKAEISALMRSIERAKENQSLQAILGQYGLSYEPLDDSSVELAAFDEYGKMPFTVAFNEMSDAVTTVTVSPRAPYRTDIYHLVFKKENGAYRFAAMYTPSVDGSIYHDSLIECDGLLYFECGCGKGWGTGTYTSNARLIPLQQGVFSSLDYRIEGYDCPWSLSENVALKLTKAEKANNGGVHFVLEGSFWYEHFGTEYLSGLKETLCGTLTFHAYDDNDGKGFYTYTEDTGARFDLWRSERLKEALAPRTGLLMRANDDTVALNAEDIVWELGLKPEGYPYMNYGELEEVLSPYDKLPYTQNDAAGIKTYFGNGAALPKASGTLTEAGLEALKGALGDPRVDVEKALTDAGLEAPKGIFSLQLEEGALPPDARRINSRTLGDALALELRIGEKTYLRCYKTLYLLFLKEGSDYAFITAFEKTDIWSLDDEDYTELLQAGGLYYWLYPFWWEGDEISQFYVPFLRGDATCKLLLRGGCTLEGLTGTPLLYSLEMGEPTEQGARLAYDASLNYYSYDPALRFSIPLTLYNDGDGKGFYALDANAPYLLGDILQVPHAKEQLYERLRRAAQSSSRQNREGAEFYLEKVFGE